MSVALSIMTPVYNGAAYLRRSYYLLTLQTFEDWEWVVVDDGSTDDTAEIVRDIQQRDSRVRLVRYEQNRGRGYARTKALQAATGEWVVVWDVDDLYLPTRLDRINRARLAGFDFYVSQSLTADPKLNSLGMHEFYESLAPLPYRTGDHSAMAVRLDLARQVGYLPALRTVGQIGEDVAMVYQLSATARGYFDEKPQAVYIVGNEFFLQKSIHANTVRKNFLRAMFERGQLPMDPADFRKLEWADRRKLLLLNLLRLCPAVYPLFMKLRARYTSKQSKRPITHEESSFVTMIRDRFTRPTRPVAPSIPVRLPQPQVAYS